MHSLDKNSLLWGVGGSTKESNITPEKFLWGPSNWQVMENVILCQVIAFSVKGVYYTNAFFIFRQMLGLNEYDVKAFSSIFQSGFWGTLDT